MSRNLNTPFSKFKKEVRRFELEVVSAFCMGYPRFGTTLVKCTLTISTETHSSEFCAFKILHATMNVYFCILIFVHFYYRGYLHMLYMLPAFIYGVSNKQFCSYFLSKSVRTCILMYTSPLILIEF